MAPEKTLRLTVHGRIIDHLGIQMYQSPVAAVAELVANTWDADADKVKISLPPKIDASATIVIQDDGLGMTLDECEARYLKVGMCRRGEDIEERSPEKQRRVLGRKGIGKFAGFGIAKRIRVETVSKATGERTVFELNLSAIRSDEYASGGIDIPVIESQAPDPSRCKDHGTTITLADLTMFKRPSREEFARSMARRFLLFQDATGFRITVNGQALPEDEDLADVEFSFPRDYDDGNRTTGLTMDGDWGIENVGEGRSIRWRIRFTEEPINDDELRGVSVFAGVKMVQRPFFFDLSGGLGGQHGQQYLFGQVKADYLDELGDDIIAPERMRVRWDHEASTPLWEWGRARVAQLLVIWRDRRGEKKRAELEKKLGEFVARLDRLPAREGRTVRSALLKLAGISTLSQRQYNDLGGALLTAWEQGRLRGLITDMSEKHDLSTEELVGLFAEADVLAALNVAEAIRARLEVVRGLRHMIERRAHETTIRDYIAKHPVLLNPRWDTYRVEKAVRKILETAAKKTGLMRDEYKGRIDLALRSSANLLLVEFMRPGLTLDIDHLNRCQRYVYEVQDKIEAETALGITSVSGLVIAHTVATSAVTKKTIAALKKEDILVASWPVILEHAELRWREYLDILIERAPEDDRLKTLRPITDRG